MGCFFFTFLFFALNPEKPEQQLAKGKSGKTKENQETKTEKRLLSILLGGKKNLNLIQSQSVVDLDEILVRG